MRAARRFRHAWRLVAAVAAVALACLGVLAVPATSQAAGSNPCDIYASAGTPCVAAYSTVRALYAAYDGPLYQVKRASDGATANVGLLSAGGYGNATEQDVFCAHTNCVITEVYDQSGRGNNLTIEGAGGAAGADVGANAAALPVTVGGYKEYGLYINGQTGYRDNSTSAVAVNGEPEGMYMVASGTHVNSGCCFDFGNAETNTRDNGAAHMDAVNLTTYCEFSPCSGSGPWVEADMENGQYVSGNGSNPNDTSSNSDFVTAVLKNNGQTSFELRGGNAQSGGLSTYWDGSLPSGYSPMHQEGAIVLGTGGDNSNASVGSFFEGVMTSGFPTDAADNAVQANIVAAGYSGNSDGTARRRGHHRRPRRPVRRRHRGRLGDRRFGGGPLELPVLRHRPALGPQLRRLAQHPRPLPRHRRRRHRRRHQGGAMGLQRRRRPEMGTAIQRLTAQSPIGTVPR